MKVMLFIAAWTFAGTAAGSQVARADPADPRAPHPPMRFDSGLRPQPVLAGSDPPRHWRALNDRVRDAGGHAGHVRESPGTAPNRDTGIARDDKPIGESPK